MVSSQCGIDLAMLVEVRRDCPTAVIEVEVEKHALAYINEQADIAAASTKSG